MVYYRKLIDKQMVAIFMAAALIRAVLFFQVIDHPKVIFQPDSRMYVSLAEGIRLHGSFCYPDTPQRHDVERVPGYPVFLAFVTTLWAGSLLPVVVLQVIIDSLSCVLIYRLAENLWEGAGWIGGLLAACNIGMITYSHFILNDSIFLFVFLAVLLIFFQFLKAPGWMQGFCAGAGIGLAAYIRPVVLYLPLFVVPFFFAYLIIHKKKSVFSAVGKVALTTGAVLLCLSPWLIRNHAHYGRFKPTSQGGEHLLQYIVPFVWQYSRGIPFIEGMKQANATFSEKMKREGIDPQTLGPFERSDLQMGLAKEILVREPKGAIVRAWMFGMIKNLFSPAIIDLSYLLDIERPHFFYTEGKTLVERGWNFIRGIKGFFGWAVIASIVGVMVSRILQVWGFFLMIRKKKWESLLCLVVVSYFLFISGPVGYAKYRLPFEPVLIVFMAISLRDLWGSVHGRHGRTS